MCVSHVYGRSGACLCSKNAQVSHEVSRWHCLAFKHGWHQRCSDFLSSNLTLRPSLSLCVSLSLLPLSLPLCLFVSLCLSSQNFLSTEDPTVDLSMSSWALSSQTSSLSLTELKHIHSSSSFASVQWQAATGQFGKALSSCEFPLQGIILSSEPVWVLSQWNVIPKSDIRASLEEKMRANGWIVKSRK